MARSRFSARSRWDDTDVYISGLDAMIVKTSSAPRTLEADPARLHYDLPEGTEQA